MWFQVLELLPNTQLWWKVAQSQSKYVCVCVCEKRESNANEIDMNEVKMFQEEQDPLINIYTKQAKQYSSYSQKLAK